MRKEKKDSEENKKPSGKKKTGGLGTMDIILIIVAACLIAFTVKMILVFETYASIPDTLVTCVFGVCGGECGVMGWIKTTKDKNKDREWEKEDKQASDQEKKQEGAPAEPNADAETDHDRNNL